MPPHYLYGTVTVNGQVLSAQDTDVRVTIEVDGVELAGYDMGDEDTDNYVLVVPMDTDCADIESAACQGDEALVYVKGMPVHENPIIIGAFGEDSVLDISVDIEGFSSLGSSSGGGSEVGSLEVVDSTSAAVEDSHDLDSADTDEGSSEVSDAGSDSESVLEDAGAESNIDESTLSLGADMPDAAEAVSAVNSSSIENQAKTDTPRRVAVREGGANPAMGIIMAGVIIALGFGIFLVTKRR